LNRAVEARTDGGTRKRWSLFSNHGVVLIFIARRPESTVREIADESRLTERHVVRILRDLVEARMIDVRKVGVRNTYRIRGSTPLRHHIMTSSSVQDLVDLFVGSGSSA
jgi:transcription initiation factor IIE alpha subunit